VPSERLAAKGGQLRGEVGRVLLGLRPLGLNYLRESSGRAFLPRPELSEYPKVRMFARRNLLKAILALPALGFLKLVLGYLGSSPEGRAPEFEEFDLTKPQGGEEPLLGNQGLAWLVRDKKGSYALLNRCSHLGCPVRFVPLESSFSCPCHGSEYDLGGRVSKGRPSGPSSA